MNTTGTGEPRVAAGDGPLVRNTGRSSVTGDSMSPANPKRAEAFRSGAYRHGYGLRSIGIRFNSIGAGSSPETELTATLNAVSGGNPGAVLCTLIDPETYTQNSVNTDQAAAADCPRLTSNTDYFVVLARANATSEIIVVSATNSNDEDSGGATGWSLGDDRHFFSSASNAWTSGSTPYRIEVRGDALLVPNNKPNCGARLLSRAFDEDTAGGQNLGQPVAATDADGHTVGYTLEGTDAGSFAIDGGAGQLTTKSGVTYNHEEKSSYSVTVKADDGNGGSATIAVTLTISDVDEPPDSPGAPTVTVTGSTTRKVTWTAPATTGRPPINGYDVRYIEASADETVDANWTDWPHSGTGTEANITGLTAVTDYKVQVRAKNNEGASDWSASGSASTNNTAPVFTQGASTGRSVPENSAAETNIGTAIAAEDPDGHSLTYSLGGPRAGLFSIVSTSGQIQTKSGVTYDHEDQSFYIVMVNADDGNSGSATITVTITISDVDEPPAAPAAPTVTFVQGTTDSLDVSWSAPVNTGKPAITDYDVQYRMGTGSWSSWAHTGVAITAQITGLAAGTAYQVRVQARNDETTTANGLWSAATVASTDAPPSLVLTASGGTECRYHQCTLVFSEALDGTTANRPPLHAFEFTASTGATTITVAADSLSISGDRLTLQALKPFIRAGQTLKLSYTDRSGANDGAALQDGFGNDANSFSDQAISNVSPYNFPTEPRTLSATANGRNRIDRSWTTPTDNGGDTSYTYRLEVSTDGGPNWTELVASQTATTYNHTGLMPGDTRHYRIFTVNIIGDSNASSVASATTNRPPAGTLRVDGSPRVAEKLTANTSGVSDGDGLPAADQFSYQWVRVDGGTETNIPGATKSTYRPVQADLGKTLKVSLSYTDLATPPKPELVTSAATSAVNVSEYGEVVWANTLTVGQDGTSLGFDRSGPVGALDPDTFGSVRVDELCCDNGTAGEVSPAGYESWTDGEHILYIGATTTYWLVGEMDSSTTDEFTFECSAIKWGANDNIEVRLTENREPVGVPLISGLIDGEPREGKPLTAGIDHITEADGLPAGDRFRYQWFVDVDDRESEISGATGASYTPKLTDLGKKYRVRVEYTDNARFPESLTSVWTDPIEVHGNVIWSAELTVKRRTHSGLRSIGFSSQFNPNLGTLEPHTFSYSGSQQIKDLNDWHLATGSNPPKSLEFGMVTTGGNSQLPDGDYHFWLVGDDDDANDLRQVPYAIP